MTTDQLLPQPALKPSTLPVQLSWLLTPSSSSTPVHSSSPVHIHLIQLPRCLYIHVSNKHALALTQLAVAMKPVSLTMDSAVQSSTLLTRRAVDTDSQLMADRLVRRY
jgi:hypothetical protein